jgi:hypothetical protein
MWINIVAYLISGSVALFFLYKVYDRNVLPAEKTIKPFNLNGKTVVSTLEKKGYFKYADKRSLEELKTELIQSYNLHGVLSTVLDEQVLLEQDISMPLCYRLYNCDQEFLYEGGFSSVFEDVGITFLKMGYPFDVTNFIESNPEEENFNQSVTINGNTYVIFQNFSDVNGWTEAFDSLMYILNAVLEKLGSDERVYAVGSDNDTQIIFLTESLFKYIQSLNIKTGFQPRVWKSSGIN